MVSERRSSFELFAESSGRTCTELFFFRSWAKITHRQERSFIYRYSVQLLIDWKHRPQKVESRSNSSKMYFSRFYSFRDDGTIKTFVLSYRILGLIWPFMVTVGELSTSTISRLSSGRNSRKGGRGKDSLQWAI